MTAQLSPEEAAQVIETYQQLGVAVQTGIERNLSAIRELGDLLSAPTMVLPRPADYISTETFYWPPGENPPHIAKVQATLDRIRLIISWSCIYPICISQRNFETDNATAAAQASLRGAWLDTAMFSPTYYGTDAINVFGTGELVLHTRGAVHIAPSPLFVINNIGDCHVSVTQELIHPPAPEGGSHPSRGIHPNGCGCATC